MTGLGDIGRIDGDGFSFACEMLADDRGVERKPVESFIFKKVTVGLFRKTSIPAQLEEVYTIHANLICRFFDPQKGSVKIGGVDVKNIRKEELMDTVSFVFQNSRLIKASVLENVRMGRPDATREEVLAALGSAQCGDILEKLPQGADTVIGTKGVYLSGGEQQRIAIARAILTVSYTHL